MICHRFTVFILSLHHRKIPVFIEKNFSTPLLSLFIVIKYSYDKDKEDLMAKQLDDLKMVHEEEMKNFDRIESAVVSVMRNHGCKIIQTPTFEDYDTYGKYFPQLQREMIKTIGPDGEVLVMRPDVTVPLVKTASREYPDPAQLLKFGYVSVVFREYYGKSTHGKYFLQSGVEVLGDETPECDGEVMVMAAEFLESVGIRDMRIDLGSVAYMDALFEELHLSDEELAKVREYLEKRNLVAFDALVDGLSITTIQRKVLLELPKLFGPYESTLKMAEDLCLNHKMLESLKRLRKVYEYLDVAGYSDRVKLDFGFTSHMGYYTDLVFKIYAQGALYSLISGGRYDSLAAQFQVPRPACGFGMNMNLLYEVMAESDLLEEIVPSCDLAVVYDNADRNLILTLMDWRRKGHSVLGVSTKNRFNPGDYKIVASYSDGLFKTDEKGFTKEEMEAKLGGL